MSRNTSFMRTPRIVHSSKRPWWTSLWRTVIKCTTKSYHLKIFLGIWLQISSQQSIGVRQIGGIWRGIFLQCELVIYVNNFMKRDWILMDRGKQWLHSSKKILGGPLHLLLLHHHHRRHHAPPTLHLQITTLLLQTVIVIKGARICFGATVILWCNRWYTKRGWIHQWGCCNAYFL